MPFKVGEMYTELRVEDGKFKRSMSTAKASTLAFGGALVTVMNQAVQLASMMVRTGARVARAMWDIMHSSAKAGDAAAKGARKVGMATRTYSAYGHAAKLAGTSINAIQMAFRTVARQALDASQGLAESKRAFDELGVSYVDNTGKLKNLNDLFLEVFDALTNETSATKQLALAQQMFGRSGQQMLPMIKAGTAALRANLKEAKALGLTYGELAGKTSEDFIDAITRMEGAWAGAKKIVFMTFADDLIAAMGSIVEWWKDNKDSFRGMVKEIRAFATALGDIAESPLVKAAAKPAQMAGGAAKKVIEEGAYWAGRATQWKWGTGGKIMGGRVGRMAMSGIQKRLRRELASKRKGAGGAATAGSADFPEPAIAVGEGMEVRLRNVLNIANEYTQLAAEWEAKTKELRQQEIMLNGTYEERVALLREQAAEAKLAARSIREGMAVDEYYRTRIRQEAGRGMDRLRDLARPDKAAKVSAPKAYMTNLEGLYNKMQMAALEPGESEEVKQTRLLKQEVQNTADLLRYMAKQAGLAGG